MTHLKPKATKAVVAEPQWRFAAFIKRRRRVARSAPHRKQRRVRDRKSLVQLY
jgi:hypothetical protein